MVPVPCGSAIPPVSQQFSSRKSKVKTGFIWCKRRLEKKHFLKVSEGSWRTASFLCFASYLHPCKHNITAHFSWIKWPVIKRQDPNCHHFPSGDTSIIYAQGIKAKPNYSAHKRQRLFHTPPNYRRHLKGQDCGDISWQQSYCCQKPGQAVGSFVPGEPGRERQEEWVHMVQCGMICRVKVNQQHSHRSGGGWGGGEEQRGNLLSESWFRPED